MKTGFFGFVVLTIIHAGLAFAGETAVVSLKDFCDSELKMAGLECPQPTTFTVKAVGAGGDYGWSYKSKEMFAYGWIIDATTRQLVWKMDAGNTEGSKDDRTFDGKITLERGRYEAYFTVPIFTSHTTFTHFSINVDHRQKPLFGSRDGKGWQFFRFFQNWWSDDMEKDWNKRCAAWGMEMLVDDKAAKTMRTFTPPMQLPNVLLQATGIGENTLVRKAFSLSAPVTMYIYALGEGISKDEMVDGAWIVNTSTRKRVWEMDWRSVKPAGGAEKNRLFAGEATLDKGDYALYYVSDDSHSPVDWNAPPPYDPLNWGVTLYGTKDTDAQSFRVIPYEEVRNVIVSLTRVRDNESRSEGFTLKQDTPVRIYAFGERSNSRRQMADYGLILDARTRNKVWTMDVDRTVHGGGASKNRLADEVVQLPKGSYIVTYNTDDSHAYGDWNAAPPFDPENYGITIMGAGPDFKPSVVAKFVEQRDKNIIAQIVRVRDDANTTETFKLDKTTRVRIYAIGEGQGRRMFDYGMIEDAKTGGTVWEMTYGMTFHAGGHRKNRMVNTTFLLDKGEYRLRYISDDSHSFGNWNVDPPEDQEYWGITVYRDERDIPVPPSPPIPPTPPE